MRKDCKFQDSSETSICGTAREIVGCRFSLYPMDNNFVSIILGTLEKTDTSSVWSQSDALSTVYRGKRKYVVDAVKAIFINAWRPDVHIAIEGQLSKGCPGDIAGESKLDIEGEAPNNTAVKDANFPALCKLSLYPMGTGDYMEDIKKVVHMAEMRGLKPQSIHYATGISGDIHQIFDYLEAVCEHMESLVSHFILHFTISINSPTNKEEI